MVSKLLEQANRRLHLRRLQYNTKRGYIAFMYGDSEKAKRHAENAERAMEELKRNDEG